MNMKWKAPTKSTRLCQWFRTYNLEIKPFVWIWGFTMLRVHRCWICPCGAISEHTAVLDCFGVYKHHWIQVECSSHFNLGCYTGVGSESRNSFRVDEGPWIQTYSDINVWRPRRFCLKRFRIFVDFQLQEGLMKLWVLNATLLELE